MSGLIVPQVVYGLSNDELAELVAKALKEIDWFANGNISDQNISIIAGYRASATELKHKSGIVGMSGLDAGNATAVRFWAGSADKSIAPYRVLQNGKVFATDGEFTGVIEALSGHIGGFTIESDKLSSDSGNGIIQGGTVIGSEIMTAPTGVYPRTAMSTVGELFIAEQSATEFIKMVANYFGAVALLIDNANVSGIIQPFGNDLLITTFVGSGNIQISSGEDLLLFAEGQTKTDSWSKFYSVGNSQTLQQALDAKQDDITSGDVTIISGVATLNAGIPATKIASGIVDNTEFQYLNGVTANIQTQLDGKASKTLPAYTSPTLAGTAVNYGSPYATAGYYKTDFGEVQCKGVIKDFSTASNTILFTFPSGSRPLERHAFSVVSGDAFGEVQVFPNGDVVFIVGTNANLWLSNIRFRAEQ